MHSRRSMSLLNDGRERERTIADARCHAHRHATSYHAPLFLAQAKGYFQDEGVKLAILEPNDPSDVTELIGRGSADMGAKGEALSPPSSRRRNLC